MRYRDTPIVQESVVIAADPQRVWELVTDVTLPALLARAGRRGVDRG